MAIVFSAATENTSAANFVDLILNSHRTELANEYIGYRLNSLDINQCLTPEQLSPVGKI